MGRSRKRSGYAQQRKYLSRMLSVLGHRPDFETVNRLDAVDVYNLLFNKFGSVELSLVYDHVQGEVLSSPRGDGSLQGVSDDE